MNKPRMFITSIAVFLSALPVAAQQPAGGEDIFKRGQSIYIVAIKMKAPFDRNFIELVNRDLPKEGAQTYSGHPRQNRTDGRPTLERTQPERTTLERSTPVKLTATNSDLKLKNSIEEIFRKDMRAPFTEASVQKLVKQFHKDALR